MKEKFQELTERFKNFWTELAPLKKVAIISACISFFVIVGLSFYLTQKVNYTTLFQGLSEAESGAIVEDLESKGIKYKIENKGTKLLIDEKAIDKFRIDLAVENKLPKKSTGFEIFDSTGMMTTDEDRKIMYQRAVTGEIERSIETLDSVEKAKVMLVLPDRSIFEEKNKDASASIVLNLVNGSIDENSIKGIASLTSGAIENLPLKNVKIVDAKGNVLSDILEEGTPNATSMISKYTEIKRDYETQLERKTEDLLGALFDKNKVRLSVNADLDFDSIERTTVTYGDTKVRSESVNASGDRLNQQQVQGGNINDNVANVIGNNNNNGSKNYQKNTNNEVDTETTKVLSAPGVVKKVSASVLINQNLSNAEKDRLEQVVRGAVGFDAKRGDTVSIQGMNFSSAEEEEVVKEKETGMMKVLQEKGAWFLVGILAIITLVILIVLLRRKNKPSSEDELDLELEEEIDVTQEVPVFMPTEPVAVEPVQPEPIEEPEEDLEAQRKLERARIERENKANEEEQKINDRLEEMATAKKYAKDNPEVAAELIRLWMKEK